MTVLRNKDLLAPDFGAMHVAAYLLAHGFRFRVVNLVADIHTSAAAFAEPEADPESMSQAVIASEDSSRASRQYLFSTLEREQPDVIFLSLSIYNLALFTRKLLGEIREVCPGSPPWSRAGSTPPFMPRRYSRTATPTRSSAAKAR